MAPTYIGSISNPVDSASATANEPVTLAVTPPASMKAGDLVVFIGHVQAAASGNVTISATGGQAWNGPLNGNANDQSFDLFWCVYNGTWGADPSLAFAAVGGTQATSAIMHVFRGHDVAGGTWAIDVAFAAGAEASASPVVITGVATSIRNTVTLAGWCQAGTIITYGTLSGTGWAVSGTAQYRNIAGTDQTACFAHRLSGVAVAAVDVSIVPSAQAAGLSFIVAWKFFRPTVLNNYNFVSGDGGTSFTESIR
jgi:hypothetical protein